MIQDGQLLNYVNGTWQKSTTTNYTEVRNPATTEALVKVPLSSRDEVGAAVEAAQAASPAGARPRRPSAFNTCSSSRNCSNSISMKLPN